MSKEWSEYYVDTIIYGLVRKLILYFINNCTMIYDNNRTNCILFTMTFFIHKFDTSAAVIQLD